MPVGQVTLNVVFDKYSYATISFYNFVKAAKHWHSHVVLLLSKKAQMMTLG